MVGGEVSNEEKTVVEIRKYLNQVVVPNDASHVYKDQCVFSFDSPESQGGLYTNLSSFLSFGRDYVKLDHEKSGQRIYLHQKWIRVVDEKTDEDQGNAPTKMTLGGDGGFQIDEEKFHFEKEHKVVVYPQMLEICYPNSNLPIGVQLSVDAILAMDDASKRATISQQTDCKF